MVGAALNDGVTRVEFDSPVTVELEGETPTNDDDEVDRSGRVPALVSLRW